MRLLLLVFAALAVPVLAQPSAEALTDVELAVQTTIEAEGIHVVHFWAPWCGNSMTELRAGLWDLVDDHPDVTFTFVTIRNGIEDGARTLERHGVPDRVRVLAQHDASTFLGLPVTWTPTTWIFNRGGELAYAFNYGEVSPALLTQALADAQNEWHHD